MSNDTKYFVRLRIGHKSEMLDRPTSTGMTHQWTVFVHSFSGMPFVDRSFISKESKYLEISGRKHSKNSASMVVFELHPDFSSPRRVVKEPPFEVSELGYGGFSIPIHITFTGASKIYKLTYDMNLVLEKYNEQFITQTIEMKQPSSTFRELILKYGGAKKDSDKRNRLRKGVTSSSEEPPPKREREKEKSRSGSNPPLSKLKIPRALVDSEKRQKNSRSASSENIANTSKSIVPAETKVTSNNETKTIAPSEVKQTEALSSEPSTSTESNCSDSEISKFTTFIFVFAGAFVVIRIHRKYKTEKQYDFEFLVRLQKKLMTLKDPDKMLAVVNTLLTPTSSNPNLPSGLLFTDNNLLSFDICKLNSSLIARLYKSLISAFSANAIATSKAEVLIDLIGYHCDCSMLLNITDSFPPKFKNPESEIPRKANSISLISCKYI
ncbi:YEATS family protein [Onchocerca flexuosa]|uniref:YEATS family protein n=1 Tax=Onchocerca flexuosa TaxID=387005 RepID=A0A238BN47_9BILA|nr:YEATS family protein [Onchocerca flexuosa]